jgi:hypothetical protein
VSNRDSRFRSEISILPIKKPRCKCSTNSLGNRRREIDRFAFHTVHCYSSNVTALSEHGNWINRATCAAMTMHDYLRDKYSSWFNVYKTKNPTPWRGETAFKCSSKTESRRKKGETFRILHQVSKSQNNLAIVMIWKTECSSYKIREEAVFTCHSEVS